VPRYRHAWSSPGFFFTCASRMFTASGELADAQVLDGVLHRAELDHPRVVLQRPAIVLGPAAAFLALRQWHQVERARPDVVRAGRASGCGSIFLS